MFSEERINANKMKIYKKVDRSKLLTMVLMVLEVHHLVDRLATVVRLVLADSELLALRAMLLVVVVDLGQRSAITK